MYQTIEEIWHEVQHTRTSRPEQILLLRLAGTQAATMTAQAVDIIRSVAGTSSVYQTNPLARRFKDIHVATQNIALRWEYYAYAGGAFSASHKPYPRTWNISGRNSSPISIIVSAGMVKRLAASRIASASGAS